jgi:hypothetical protein
MLQQMVVDELHLIENREDRVADKELTKILGRVDSVSFFDSTEVFPVGGESGAQASSLHPIRSGS